MRGRLRTASSARDDEQEVWIRNQDATDLSEAEDHAGDDKAQEAANGELLDNEVGAQAYILSAGQKKKNLLEYHVPLSNLPAKEQKERTMTCISCRFWIHCGDTEGSYKAQRA